MICIKCKVNIQDDFVYCPWCGRKQIAEKHRKVRGNGQGTVYKDGDKYRAVVVIGTYLDENGKRKRKTKSARFDKKKDAIDALVTLKAAEMKSYNIKFKELYDRWFPTHEASHSTLNNYSAAIKYFEPLWHRRIDNIDIDDLQECIDSSGLGIRTQQNMKTVCGLMYKYGIPRHLIPENLNLAPFLKCNGDAPTPRASFTDIQIEAIRRQIGKVFGAEYVYSLIYLGMRPSEYLELAKDSYDREHNALIIGKSKTEAGIRAVTISPKINSIIQKCVERAQDALICDASGRPYNLKAFTENVFYPVLEAAEIENPVIDGRHKFTPHSCRHTFSTLMKRVSGADKDKLELIGHTSTEMLRYYQDVEWKDLQAITDAI